MGIPKSCFLEKVRREEVYLFASLLLNEQRTHDVLRKGHPGAETFPWSESTLERQMVMGAYGTSNTGWVVGVWGRGYRNHCHLVGVRQVSSVNLSF